MAEQGLVSVVIPFLNAEPFLEETIASVRAQTYSSWELILVDDGSDDGSRAVAERHAGAEPSRVRCLEHPGHTNRGSSASRNLGFEAARGEFVAFLDADDVWVPRKVEEQVAILRAEFRACMVYGASEYWHSWKRSTPERPDHVVAPGFQEGRLVEPPNLLVAFLEHRGAIPPTGNPLFRRTAVDDVGGFESSFTGLHDDQAFYAKLSLRHPVYVAHQCWDRYRQRPDSLCGAAGSGEMDRARRVYLDWLARYLKEQDCRDPRVWRALARSESRRGRVWRLWRKWSQRVRELGGRT